jgi:hypothetical protein
VYGPHRPDRIGDAFGELPSGRGLPKNTYYVDEQVANTNMFAAFHLLDMIKELLQKYHAVFEMRA